MTESKGKKDNKEVKNNNNKKKSEKKKSNENQTFSIRNKNTIEV